MPASSPVCAIRSRASLLPRTRLAYVHLRNLLTDAKRDRAARVSGYVAISLPEELVVLYLLGGEVVNATHARRRRRSGRSRSRTRSRWCRAEPEYGEICFHEAEDEQLACMFASADRRARAVAAGAARRSDPAALFPYLMRDDVRRRGRDHRRRTRELSRLPERTVARALSRRAGITGTLVERVAQALRRERPALHVQVRRWGVPAPLRCRRRRRWSRRIAISPTSLVQRLVDRRRDERARDRRARAAEARRRRIRCSTASRFTDARAEPSGRRRVADRGGRRVDPRGDVGGGRSAARRSPDDMLRELTCERRHMFQSAGLFDRMPWKVM